MGASGTRFTRAYWWGWRARRWWWGKTGRWWGLGSRCSDSRPRREKRKRIWRRDLGGNSRSTGGGRGFCCRKCSECKELRRYLVRPLFSIGFLDAAEVIEMDARPNCAKDSKTGRDRSLRGTEIRRGKR